MLDTSVRIMGGKYLSKLRLCDTKANRLLGCIRSVINRWNNACVEVKFLIMLKLSVCVSSFLVFVAFKRRCNPIVFYPWNYSVLHTHRKSEQAALYAQTGRTTLLLYLLLLLMLPLPKFTFHTLLLLFSVELQ